MNGQRLGLRHFLVAGILAAAVTVGCGGGGGGVESGTAVIGGNVSSSSAAVQGEKRTWLAWLADEVLGVVKQAYAAAVGGLDVSVEGPGRRASAVTDDGGNFSVGGAPTGDVSVVFSRGNCRASVPVSDVSNGSTLDLRDVTVSCNSARVRQLAETFQGVLLNKPASPNGNLNVCASGGGGNHVRAVKTRSGATFENTSFEDLQEGDLLEVSGEREGIGAFSALEASLVRVIGSGDTGNCQSLPTPTPEPTATPTPVE